jgi:hypothetical protein
MPEAHKMLQPDLLCILEFMAWMLAEILTWQGFDCGSGKEFSFHHNKHTGCKIHPASCLWILCALSPEKKAA